MLVDFSAGFQKTSNCTTLLLQIAPLWELGLMKKKSTIPPRSSTSPILRLSLIEILPVVIWSGTILHQQDGLTGTHRNAIIRACYILDTLDIHVTTTVDVHGVETSTVVTEMSRYACM